MTNYPLRPILPEEHRAFVEARASAFGVTFRPEELERTERYADLSRTIAAWEGDQVVATAGAWTFSVSVPGGDLACAGVTWVSVRPTHRRQGILTSMMRHQLDDVRDRGEPIAMLWASEVPIYGRFGYGLAAEGMELRIERTRTALLPGFEPAGRTRFVTRGQALADWPKVYEAARKQFPAMHSRSAAWWEHRLLREPESPPAGYSPSFFVQYEEGGQVLAYVRYRVKEQWTDGGADNQLSVVELMAVSDAAYAAIWRFVFDVDLVGTIHAEWRRTDEPLHHMLVDSRRLFRRPTDTVFCRIVDPIRALEGRRYAVEGRVVLEVTDAFCPWAAGRYLVEGGPDGATCTPTTLEPDVTLGARELGAVYFGHTRLTPLLRAGRLCGEEAAVRRADAMFGWPVAPWSPEIW
jgi:predicted acetyltransferase